MILLDENMPGKLRHAFAEFAPATVKYMGWGGLRNGDLLNAAEESGFTVLVTGDKTLQFEQNLSERKIAVVSLSSPHWDFMKERLPMIVEAVRAATPESFAKVDSGVFSRRKAKPKEPQPVDSSAAEFFACTTS